MASCSQKYGAPLYCGLWLTEELVVLGGGGGKKSSGIPNRLVVARWAHDALSPEPVCTFSTGAEPPQRLALHPDGTTLLCAFNSGLQLLRVRTSTGADGAAGCELVAAEPPPGAALLSDFADTKCLAFSADGGRLAVGSEDGRLRLLSWPALRVLGDEARAHPDAVSDADFSPDGALLLTTGNEPWGAAGGACVWRVAGQALQRERWLGSFGAPPRARVTLRGARFARDGSGRAFTGVNVAGEARVVAWRVADWAPLALKRALSEPLTSLALSPIDGRLIAAGGAEGSVVMLGARTLAPLRRVKNAHMVFVTAVAFSPAGATLASLSGDASARCTAAPPRKSFIAAVVRLLLLLAVQAIFFCLVLLARKRGVF